MFSRIAVSSTRCGAVFLALSIFATPVVFSQITLVDELDPDPGVSVWADVWGEDRYAYLGTWGPSGDEGVAIIDLDALGGAALVAVYNGAGSPDPRPYQDVKVFNGVGYFGLDDGSNDGTDIVDLSDPTNPVLLKRLSTTDGGLAGVHNVFVHVGFLYQSDSSTATVTVFNVTNPPASPSDPVFVRDIVTPGGAIHDVTVLGGRLFAADIANGATYIYDVTSVDTVAPPLLATIPSVPSSHSSWVTGDGTVLVNAEERDDGSVTLWDISDPTTPILRSTLKASMLGLDAISPHNPVVSGDILFVAWYEAGVQVFDISNPAAPVHLGGFDTFAPAATGGFDGNWGVYPFLGDDRVLLSDTNRGLIVVDVSAVTDSVVFADGFESGDVGAWAP